MTEPQLWISVFELGSFFGLVALCYYLVLEGAGFFNFAIGPYSMFAALGTSWLVVEHELTTWPAVGLGLLAAALLAVLTELLIIRPIEARGGGGELAALVAVSAVLFLVQQLAGYLFGRRQLPGQPLLTIDPITIGSSRLTASAILLVGLTLSIFALTALLIRKTSTGRMLRAVGNNKAAATVLGLPVSRIRLTSFAASGVIAGTAGILFAPKAGVGFNSGLSWTLNGFLALVVGGTGSVWAPLLGGLMLGALQVFVPYYFGSEAPHYTILGVALLFFAFRPEGLSSQRVRA